MLKSIGKDFYILYCFLIKTFLNIFKGTGAVKSVGSKLIGSSNPGTFTVIKTLNSTKENVLSDLLLEENYIECRHDVIIREEQVMTVLKSIQDEKSRDYLLQEMMHPFYTYV